MTDDTSRRLIHYPTVRGIVTGLVVALFAAVFGVVFSSITPSSVELWLFGAFPDAGSDEALIVVAPFKTTEGVTGSLPHREIKVSIESEVNRLGLSDRVRVEEFPRPFRYDNKDRASSIIDRYGANLVIWGDVTNVTTYVSYLGRNTSTSVGVSDPSYAGSLITQQQLDEYTTFITKRLPNTSKFFTLYALSYAYSNIGEIDKAIQVLNESSDYGDHVSQSSFRQLDVRLGSLHIQNGEYPNAVKHLTYAINADSTSGSTFNKRALAYVKNDDIGNALKDFNKAIKIDSSALYLTNRGVARLSAGNHSGALSDFNSAITMDSTFSLAYNMRGAYTASRGNPRRALDDYNKAISINTDFATAYRNKGIAHERLGDTLTAHEYFTKAIRNESNSINNASTKNALVNRGVAHLRLGYIHQAINDLTRAINTDSGMISAYRHRAIAYQKIEHYVDAIKDYDKIIDLEPLNYDMYNKRGRLHMKLNNTEEAENDFKESIALNSNDFLPHQNLASFYLKNGRKMDALKKYNDAASIKPNAYIYATRGIIRARLGCTERAHEDLRRALSLDTRRARRNITLLQSEINNSRYKYKDCDLEE